MGSPVQVDVLGNSYDITVGDQPPDSTVIRACDNALLSKYSSGHVFLDVDAKIQTEDGPGAVYTITGATFYWYLEGYYKVTKKPPLGAYYTVAVYDGVGYSWETFYTYDSTSSPSAGLYSEAMTGDALAAVGSGTVTGSAPSGTDTELRFWMDTIVGGTDWRYADIAAYEHSTLTACYMSVSYTLAGGGAPRLVIVGV